MHAHERLSEVNERSGDASLSPAGHDLRLLSPAVEHDDPELARRLRDGDADALGTLYDRYAAAVHGLTRAILRDDRLAEEATHDVFLGLWQRPRIYEASRGSFGGWLLRIARNRAIDLLRRSREQPFPTVPGDDGSISATVESWLVDPDPDPADQAVTGAIRQDVRTALARLSPDQRQLLELAYFGGLTQREIAALVDRPLGTIKTQIRTAMQRLAALLVTADPSLAGGVPRGSNGLSPVGSVYGTQSASTFTTGSQQT